MYQYSNTCQCLKGFKVLYNDQREEEFDLQGDTHRMIYEFKEFVKMIENKDLIKQMNDGKKLDSDGYCYKSKNRCRCSFQSRWVLWIKYYLVILMELFF